MKKHVVAAAALVALSLAAKADAARNPDGWADLPKSVLRYGANAEVTFKVVDTDGKPVAGVSVCGIETDAAGVAIYRGIVADGRLLVSVSSSDIYSPVVAPVVLSALSDDKKSFVPTNVPPIVVRRRVKPHEMECGTVSFGNFIRDRPLVTRRETKWFNVEVGRFPGVSDNRGYCNLHSSYIVLEPKTQEDGFQELEPYPDSLGTPLAAPSEGYVAGPFEMMSRTNDRDGGVATGDRIVAFRHKTPEGFVYGIVKMCGAWSSLEFRVNSVAGELSLEQGRLSLEPEECR